MKKAFSLSLIVLSSTAPLAQNKTVVPQQGTGNTSIVSQSGAGSPKNVAIAQSGSGNVVTIHQKSTMDGRSDATHSVTAGQTGAGETIIHQTNAGNTLRILQSGRMPVTTEEKSHSKQPRK
jgi:minor curlin subunit